MRISDWSSDVCSSDLGGESVEPAQHARLVWRDPQARQEVGEDDEAEDEVDGDNEGRRKIRRRRDEEGDGGEIERDEAVAELRRALASDAVEAVDSLLPPVCSNRCFPFGAGRGSLTQALRQRTTEVLDILLGGDVEGAVETRGRAYEEGLGGELERVES